MQDAMLALFSPWTAPGITMLCRQVQARLYSYCGIAGAVLGQPRYSICMYVCICGVWKTERAHARTSDALAGIHGACMRPDMHLGTSNGCRKWANHVTVEMRASEQAMRLAGFVNARFHFGSRCYSARRANLDGRWVHDAHAHVRFVEAFFITVYRDKGLKILGQTALNHACDASVA